MLGVPGDGAGEDLAFDVAADGPGYQAAVARTSANQIWSLDTEARE